MRQGFLTPGRTHCLRYGILEPAEIVANLSGERTQTSKVDGVQCDRNQFDGLGRNPLVRLVLANFGGESKYAVKVAE
ncbi:hypothetical protein [Lentzea flaviverrucosa]|uniref:Uncharacterized protein n=1 Tax=Lentzea flaviverrucosa TaxID=200379 RepID=A0A1H9XX19_9PSEU|nr:hypothetical protein [Lentzea flaviverrucosa]RDI17431.1 hypothetical protein DFR72_12162 [Lentzea flaviverrucosa]SES50701.1 hypothetical protein SAMN05216195_121126 [Lentzea flaviverrucosa]